MSQQTSEKSWWRRYKWPLAGCGCLTAILIFVVAIFVFFISVMGILRNTEPFTDSWELASAHPKLIEIAGEPLEAGRLVTGNVAVSGPSGEANLHFSVNGPDEEGDLYVHAKRRAGQWEYESIDWVSETSDTRLDLLQSSELPRYQLKPSRY